MKKFIIALIFLAVLCFFASCSSESVYDEDAILSDILKSYRTDGMTSWWEILAVYNADENPMDYKGFDDVLSSLEGNTNLKMASYVIVSNVAVAIGADAGYFEKYEEYKAILKNLVENPTDDYNLNDYIFGYFALKTSGMDFDEFPFFNYLIEAQKSDGGFALSGDKGDVDMTAFAIQAMRFIENPYYSVVTFITPTFIEAVNFLESSINENGTFTSYGNENAESTACAFSALIGGYNAAAEKASDGLALFKVKKEIGYSHLKGGKSDVLATAQAAIALSDLKNNACVWEKLYQHKTHNEY